MAVVLSTEDNSYFVPTSLRRSHSQSKFAAASHSQYPSSTANPADSFEPGPPHYTSSAPSSAPSSPRNLHAESTDVSYASTPVTNFSIASDFDESLAIDESPEDHFGFPAITRDGLFTRQELQPDDNLEPPPSPRTGDSYTVTPDDQDASSTSRPGTPECGEHAEDDTAVATRPSRQVDYLSHDWREEDIWSSWRYIVSRRDEYPNSARLENASWRTWMKAKNNLRTISPETLNWLKDCDVTWLYGPLQSGSSHIYSTQTEPSSIPLSKADSLIDLKKKPILKKRSMSEIMLQRSLSTASLLKQATAAVQAQETRGIMRPSLVRSQTDYVTFPFSTRRSSHGNGSSLFQSAESSGITSPGAERKHIHFNEQVEQCIAVELKGEEDDDVDTDPFHEDTDSDDVVMMKRTRSKRRKPSARKSSKKAAVPDGKIIAMLPSTTLKYREDGMESPDSAMRHSTGVLRSPQMSPSSSQETLKPTKPSHRFYFDEQGDDEMEDAILNSKPGWRSPPMDTTTGGVLRSTSSASLSDEPAGMRRTPSGMFMPYEEGEPSSGDGIFGRVVDTVNTARDIAHVIWNVGWRK